MKTIGFIDYFLSEWHANNYPEMIKKSCELSGKEYVVKYAWAEVDVSPYDNVTTDEWCAKYGVEKCSTIEELCEKSDYIIILAPDNPEKHLEYALKAFPYAKNTYVDKTFAPDKETAEKIFDIAEKYGVKMFSTSALRCASEIQRFNGNAFSVITQSAGGLFDAYAIHHIEMVVKCMGANAKRVMCLTNSNHVSVKVEFENDRNALMIFSKLSGMPFSIDVEMSKDDLNGEYIPITSAFFDNLINDILELFESGKIIATREETCSVMAIRQAVVDAIEKPMQWVEVK